MEILHVLMLKRKDLHFLYCKTVGFMTNCDYSMCDNMLDKSSSLAQFIIDVYPTLNPIHQTFIRLYVEKNRTYV